MDFSLVGGTYIVTTVGSWNLGPNGTWDDMGMGYAFSFENGTTLPYPPQRVLGALTWQTKQVLDVCSPSLAQHGSTEFRDATIAISYNNGALINTKAGTYTIVFADSAYTQRANGSGFPFNVSGGFLNVYSQDISYLGPGSIEKTLTGTLLIYVCTPSSIIDSSLYPFVNVQGLFVDLFGSAVANIPATGNATGALLYSQNILYVSNGTNWVPALLATGINYIPAVLANWNGVAPTNGSNAWDRIAAKIGPIP